MCVSSPTQSVTASVRDLPCGVEIPEDVRERLFRGGVAHTTPAEQRRFARFNCGNESSRIGVRYLNNIYSLPRKSEWRGGILIDLSRGGLQFLHEEAVYPGEKARFALTTEGALQILDGEVAWCRRFAAKCYGVGIRFLQSAPEHHQSAISEPPL